MELKDVSINKAYQINEDGTTLISKRTGRKIKPAINIVKGKPSGYLYATMCNGVNEDGEYFPILPVRTSIHRLVAFAWLPPAPSPKHVWINHKDGNKSNNHYTNLEWTTISQNIQHAFDTGLKVSKRGKEHHLYGRKMGKSTRNKMSVAKLGINHPKFKGHYFVEFKKYESANQASIATGLPAKTIINRCNNPKFKIKGYYFLPK